MRISKVLVLTIIVAAQCFGIPISFEQRDSRHFLARLANGAAELQPDRVVLPDVTLRFLEVSRAARLEGLGAAASSTYLRAGFNRTFLQFPKLAIHNLYPGVNAIFYGSGQDLEYDLNIAAGVSVDRIRIVPEGAREVRIDEQGNLVIRTEWGELRQMRPRIFQREREIPARYVLIAANEIGLQAGKHDRRFLLTVDPVLASAKYFGGTGSNTANAIATDSQGNIYVAGQSNAVDFPTTSNSFQPRFTPPLRVLSNAGKTSSPLRVGTATSVGVVGGTKDGRILYAATSDGIFVSGDRGATWRQTAPLLSAAGAPAIGPYFNPAIGPQVTVNAISVDALDPATLLVATNVGLFGTDSGGQFWGARNTGLAVSASGFVSTPTAFYSPVNPLIAYAVTSNPSYLFASADAGNTWKALNPTYPGEPPPPTDPFPSMVATLSPDGSVLYAVNGNGTLLKSEDGGKTWVKLATGFFGPLSMQVDPANASTLFVLDQLGLNESRDGGVSFSKLTTPVNVQAFAVDASGAVYVTDTNKIYASAGGVQAFAPVPHSTGFLTSLSALAGNVYAGSVSPQVPFVMKLDPTGSNILYSTFIGGSNNDSVAGLAVDAQGQAVLVGSTLSPDFPLTVPAANPPTPNKPDGFIAKLSADGAHLIFSTALGGSKPAFIQGVALDSSGTVFVTGSAYSGDFPTTAHAFQPALPLKPCPRPQGNPFVIVALGSNAFAAKLSGDGKSLAYSTFLTGSCGSWSQGIGLDSAGDAIVFGYTTSPDFPVSPHSYQPAFPGQASEPSPPALYDAGFVTKLSAAGDKVIAGTYLGGGYATQANAVALDEAGSVYISGVTQGIAPGATPGAYQTSIVQGCGPSFSIGPSPPYTGTGDAFVLKLDAALSSAAFLTYLGGSCNDSGNTIAVDAAGNIWVSGTTASSDFPLKEPFQASQIANTSTSGFVAELSGDASQLLFSSFSDAIALALGPAAVDLAGASGKLALVARIDPAATPAMSIESVTAVTGFPPATVVPSQGIAPGQLVEISGRKLGPAAKINGQLDATGRLPFILGDTVVFFDNFPAPLISVQAGSIVCFVPFAVSAPAAEITVLANGQRSSTVRMGVAPSAPQILAIVNQDGTVNSAGHPAPLGSVIAVYVSGLGQTDPPGDDGLTNAAPLPVPLAAVMVNVPVPSPPGQITPQFVGGAPGMIAGITQVNVQLPANVVATGGVTSISVNSPSATLYVKH